MGGGKSSSQANTTTSTSYTTTTNTNIGLTGSDVNNLVTTFANFALATENNAHNFSNVGVETTSPYPQDDVPTGGSVSVGLSSPIVIIGAILVFILLMK